MSQFTPDELLGDATYSPDDDKLRLYPEDRLPKEIYNRLLEAGFRWAPTQELFFAKWSPDREDLLLEMAQSIEDDDMSLVERAEARADRFEIYADNRQQDALAANQRADQLSERFAFGQPILIGHHSEKKARRDQARIHESTHRALSMWDKADYWNARAQRAIASAKYRQSPRVRVGRIHKLEAEIRKYRRAFTPKNPDQQIFQRPVRCPICQEATCKEHLEAQTKVPHVYCGASRGGAWVPIAALPIIERCYSRWIAHAEKRLAYEKAMLESEGKSDLLKPKPRPRQPPLLNYRAEKIHYDNEYRPGETCVASQVELTKAQYRSISTGNRQAVKVGNGNHRVRLVCVRAARRILGVALHDLPPHPIMVSVFLTDSKVHPVPEVQTA